eukprot:TRINITY_DN6460_c0_g1_i2.p1 TRINITY_DN6460_c0_g1~~TRINITY_DN6460_c0_g1_i2.p1  ORF type:complete len:458 (-),score=123.84 TRINITY_DN6460_c0_g1_i2:89-1462(-)
MSYRELRNFTEIMRGLGYPRLISVENFRIPHFDLVADILLWLVKQYDPQTDLVLDLKTSESRVAFLKAAAQAMNQKAQIKLNIKKLYQADGYAVQELLKISTILYKSSLPTLNTSNQAAKEDADSGSLSLKLDELKSTRSLASSITSFGAAIHELLAEEPELSEARSKATARPLDTEEVENAIKLKIRSVNENITSLTEKLENLAADEANLEAKIEKKKGELERTKQRLRSLQGVRPAFMDEYERLEGELQNLYAVYLLHFRNVEYLENELEEWNRAEQAQFEANAKALSQMQQRIRQAELKNLRDGKTSSLGMRDEDEDFGREGDDVFEEVGKPPKPQTIQNGNPRMNQNATRDVPVATSTSKPPINGRPVNNGSNNAQQQKPAIQGKVHGSMIGGDESESDEDLLDQNDDGSESIEGSVEGSDMTLDANNMDQDDEEEDDGIDDDDEPSDDDHDF